MMRQAAVNALRGARRFTTSSTCRSKDAAWEAIEHGPQYRIQEMTNRKFKFGTSIVVLVVLGTVLPVVAGEVIKYKMK